MTDTLASTIPWFSATSDSLSRRERIGVAESLGVGSESDTVAADLESEASFADGTRCF